MFAQVLLAKSSGQTTLPLVSLEQKGGTKKIRPPHDNLEQDPQTQEPGRVPSSLCFGWWTPLTLERSHLLLKLQADHSDRQWSVCYGLHVC